jgi:hypothetical protein
MSAAPRPQPIRAPKAAAAGEAPAPKPVPDLHRPAEPDELYLPIAPPPSRPLRAIVDGRPVSIVDAIAATHGESAVTVELSNRRLQCGRLGSGWQELGRGEESIRLVLSQPIVEPTVPNKTFRRPDERRWRVKTASWRGGLEIEALGIARVPDAVAVSGRRTSLDLDYEASFQVSGDSSTVRLIGRVAVRGCGSIPKRVERRGDARKFSFELAGQPLRFEDAILRSRPSEDGERWEVVLSSGPKPCPNGLWLDADDDLEATFKVDGSQMVLGGRLMPSDIGEGGKSSIAVEVLPGATPDRAHVRIRQNVPGLNPLLAYGGEVEARRCPVIPRPTSPSR